MSGADEASIALRRLVLVGGGNAHVRLLRALVRRPIRGLEIVLVTPEREHYHRPMMSAVLRGVQQPESARVDLGALAERAGARAVWSEADAIDVKRHAVMAAGERIPFDACSIDLVVGSRDAHLPGVKEHAMPLRWMELLPEVRETIEARIAAAEGPVRCAVVGGGVSGVEAAFAVQRMLERSPHGSVLTIVDAGQSILSDAAPCAPAALRLLERLGVCFALGARVVEVRPTGLVLASGAVLSANLVLWATGADAPAIIRASGLPHDEAARLQVDGRLRAIDGSPVWAVGDAIARSALGEHGPRSHRLAAMLEHELRLVLGDRWHRASRPGREGCRVDTGDERAISDGPPYRGHSRFGGWLKRRLDRGFVEL